MPRRRRRCKRKRSRAAKKKDESAKHALAALKKLSLEKEKKKNGARGLASAPLAEAPGGSAIALTPVSGTEAITPEAESGRKRRRVASRGTLAGDADEKEPPSRLQNKGEREREGKTSAAIAAFKKGETDVEKKHRKSSPVVPLKSQFGCCHPVLSYSSAFCDGPAFAESLEIRQKSNESPRKKSGGGRRRRGKTKENSSNLFEDRALTSARTTRPSSSNSKPRFNSHKNLYRPGKIEGN